MTRPLHAAAADVGIEVDQLTIWIDRRWVRPIQLEGEPAFDEADLARLRMIVDFSRDLAIDEDSMPVVLDLLDRLHAARTRLRAVLRAIAELPEPMQSAIVERIIGVAEP